MKRTALFVGLLALPVAVFALDFSDATEQYKDAPFSKAETAGISVLTNLTAVTGNPDGTFAPERVVNRAEFLKILFRSHPDIAVTDNDAADCFPDVRTNDWFSSYVCLAKTRNVVGGYPDGFFRPANPVNYVEALKMLSELYSPYPVVCLDGGARGDCAQYKTYEVGAPWYEQYTDWAAAEGLLIPSGPALAAPLTRGQVARLAASYRAWFDGELALYRDAERGLTPGSSSSMMSSVSSVSSSSTSSASSQMSASEMSSASSSSSIAAGFPAVSHFLLTGTRTPVVVDGIFTSASEDGVLRIVDVTLRQEVKSIASMILVDQSGKEITTLTLGTEQNSDRRKWRASLPENGTYKLLRGVPTMLGLKYVLYDRASGGVPNEFVDGVEKFSLSVSGVATNASMQIVPTSTHYPQHQTSDSRVTGVSNAGSPTDTMTPGNRRLIGKFAITGQTATGGILHVTGLTFTIDAYQVSVSNIRIGGAAEVEQADCGIDSAQNGRVVCGVIPELYREVSKDARILSVYADVAVNEGHQDGSLRIMFAGRGQIGQAGALKWEDSTGRYNWVEAEVPFESGTLWTVKP